MKVSFHYVPGEGFDSDDGKDTVRIYFSQDKKEMRHAPTELLLLAVGSCTSDDVLSILRKMRQEFSSYRCEVSGEKREEHPRLLRYAHIRYIFEGPVDPEKARKAIHLSLRKYCSVSITIERGGVRVLYSLIINGETVDDSVDVESIKLEEEA
ncbi:osmotically inducible protein C [Thermoplasma sp. Kam2015]|uniref:OsmC family protein n=1 Tax=Thermoplasma sp. Kam2015 TaxID=2094122 RepID=UPI000D931E40|nr:OsmC family protein [Thermoplasma sp. Kam2015]PYB67624.1 osmotically inducible protein C [Thermoplasma sp. Kam2015]